MPKDMIQNILIILALAAIGPNSLFWGLTGVVRFFSDQFGSSQLARPEYSNKDVAVVIAAHNEEAALPSCLAAILRLLPTKQIFIGNDASRDATAKIATKLGCKVYTAPTNIGKARVLDVTIRRFRVHSRFKLILFLDADSQIDSHYFENALPLFNDPEVAVLAGHVISRQPLRTSFIASAIHLYRVRLYAMVQFLFKFGQTWKPMDVTFVAPGFASTYRSSVLKQLDIAASGLVIEDINMTFEVHRKKLGRVVYSPDVRCCTEDPASILDYSKQVRRWTLGLWQTFAHQGLWYSKFCVALVLGQFEVICFSIFALALPIYSVIGIFSGWHYQVWFPLNHEIRLASPLLPLILYFMTDLAISIVVAIFARNFWLIAYSPIFPILRFIDAYWTLATIILTFFVKSDGRWKSPKRYLNAEPTV